jgi:hypothetical protein
MTYKGFLPEIKLYRMDIMATTNQIWIRLLVPKPSTKPKRPSNHIPIQITATNQRRFLILKEDFS